MTCPIRVVELQDLGNQLAVIAGEPDIAPKRIGYVSKTDPLDYWAPLCYFPMEHAPAVQEQIDRMRGINRSGCVAEREAKS